MSISATRKLGLALAVGLFITAGSVGFWRSRAQQRNPPTDEQMVQHARHSIREGVGEVYFAAPNSGWREAARSIESLANMMEARAGVLLSTVVRGRLVRMEWEVLSGTDRPIGLNKFTDALAETIVERVARLSDEEVKEAYRSYTANQEGLGAHLRADGEFSIQTHQIEYWLERARSDCANNGLLRTQLESVVRAEVQRRASDFGAAVPEQFASLSTVGMRPAHATLLVYSVVTDDGLYGLSSDLPRRIAEIRRVRPRHADSGPTGIPRAYGQYGHLYASPAELFFDDATIGSFFHRLNQEGGNR
jgi:hypothetical protein